MNETKPTIRTGKLFEAGPYPDKGLTVTTAQLRQAASDFKGPLRLNLEHYPSVLDGQLGTLDSVTVSDDGRELFGTVTEPAWLTTVLGNTARRVSLEWDVAKKQITGIALVIAGRVPDAVLFTAFSRDARFRAENEVDFSQVDLCLREAGLPPATRPRANPITADGVDLDQVDAALAQFTAWKPGN